MLKFISDLKEFINADFRLKKANRLFKKYYIKNIKDCSGAEFNSNSKNNKASNCLYRLCFEIETFEPLIPPFKFKSKQIQKCAGFNTCACANCENYKVAHGYLSCKSNLDKVQTRYNNAKQRLLKDFSFQK